MRTTWFRKPWSRPGPTGRGSRRGNLRAWLFTILRNSWYTGAARRRREVADEEGRHAAGLTSEANQGWTAELTALQ